jgi:hypothetical protein
MATPKPARTSRGGPSREEAASDAKRLRTGASRASPAATVGGGAFHAIASRARPAPGRALHPDLARFLARVEVAGARPARAAAGGRSLIQRWPAGFTGLAGELTLLVDTQLFHGTPAAAFTHDYLAPAGPSPIHYEHPPTPDPPAWFSRNILFALHAGVRSFPAGAAGQMTLHVCRVRSAVNLMRFNDLADLSAYLISQERQVGAAVPAAPALNDVDAAVRWHRLYSTLDGYSLDHDTVRNEEEIVLFEAGLRKLEVQASPLNVTPSPMPAVPPGGGPAVAHHTITTQTPGPALGNYYHTGGPGTFV